jgi:hypothetical protein
MSEDDNRALRAPLLALPTLLALWIIGSVLLTFLGRLSYPYDLEWMEGGVLAHAWRVSHGLPLYVQPGPDFIPMIYPPGYPTLLATLGSLFGLSHTLGRAVSIAGTLAACAAMLWSSHRHLREPWLGLLGVAVFLGMYESSGAFYDLVRPDGLALGLLTWAIVLGLEDDDKQIKRAGLLLFGAFVFKHNTAALGFAMTFGIWARLGLRSALLFVAWSAIPGLLLTLAMDLGSSGRFTTWLLAVPRSHPMVHDRGMPGAFREMASALPVACVAVALWVLHRTPRESERLPQPLVTVTSSLVAVVAIWTLQEMPKVKGIQAPEYLPAMLTYASVGLTLAAGAWWVLGAALDRRVNGTLFYAAGIGLSAWFTCSVMRAHHGGFLNVYMFLHWTMAYGLVVAAREALREVEGWRGVAIAAAAFTLQLGHTASNLDLDRLVPTEADRAAGDELVAYLRECEGPVLSPFNPWLAAQAGHDPGYHLIAMWDIRFPAGPFHADVEHTLDGVTDRYYGTIVDASDSAGLGISKAYKQDRAFEFGGNVFMPKTGWRRRPSVIWKR